MIIREIIPTDNKHLANIIRTALTDFDAAKPGTVYFDESTDHLYELFQAKGSAYFIAETKEGIAGGAGIFPTEGLEKDTCELVKMYLSKEARGKGYGNLLLQKSIDEALLLGYKKMYLETMPELIRAIPMYEKFGFKYLKGPLGNTGHSGCHVWMLKNLS